MDTIENRYESPPAAGKIFLRRYRKVIAGLFLAAGAVYFAKASFILPLKLENGGIFIADYKLLEEKSGHPRLQLLRRREHLDEVIAPGKTQFDKQVLLRKWTRRQWEPGVGNFYYPPWDALEILDLARKHGNRAFCAQYGIVYLQALLSVGCHARYIDLPGHFVVGVWSDDYNEWVVMDPYNDLHYEGKDGRPESGFSLHNAYVNNDVEGIKKVTSDGVRTPVTREELAAYRMYSIDLRNNHLSEPVICQVNGREKPLAPNPDYRTYPLVGRDAVGAGDTFLAYKSRNEETFEDRIYSDDYDDFRDDKNQTIIYYAMSLKEPQAMKILLLADDSPEFKAFMISTDGVNWSEVPDKIDWELRPGINTLSARILTNFGWRGYPSRVKVFYKPSWLSNRPKVRESHRRYVRIV